MPPDASTGTRPADESDRLGEVGDRHVVEQDEIGLRLPPRAPARPACGTRPRAAGLAGAARARGPRASKSPPPSVRWLSFTRIASSSAIRWFVPPPVRTAYFASTRMPGMVLRVSRTTSPVPATRSTYASRERRDAAQVLQEVQRRVARRRAASARRPSTVATTSPGLASAPSAASTRHATAPEPAEDAIEQRQPAHHELLLGQERGPRARAVAGTVASDVRSPSPRSSASASAMQRGDLRMVERRAPWLSPPARARTELERPRPCRRRASRAPRRRRRATRAAASTSRSTGARRASVAGSAPRVEARDRRGRSTRRASRLRLVDRGEARDRDVEASAGPRAPPRRRSRPRPATARGGCSAARSRRRTPTTRPLR